MTAWRLNVGLHKFYDSVKICGIMPKCKTNLAGTLFGLQFSVTIAEILLPCEDIANEDI